MKKNLIGLETTAIAPVISQLEQLLADYHTFYANLRGLHWNIRGDKFFELHELYEQYYDEAADAIDEIAERIIQLGAIPENRLSKLVEKSRIAEIGHESDWQKGVESLIENLKLLHASLTDLAVIATKVGDVGTLSLAGHTLKAYEKKLWMLKTYMD